MVNSELKTFKVESFASQFDLQFNFPKTFINVKEIDLENLSDTTNYRLNWILNKQYENSEYTAFYDSIDLSLNVFIQAGPRIDISNYERKRTYFSVPTVRLDKVFPPESEKLKIVYESGEMKHNDKKYFKRIYQIKPDSLGYQEYFHISTEWQSTLIVVNSTSDSKLDSYLLGYNLISKPKADN